MKEGPRPHRIMIQAPARLQCVRRAALVQTRPPEGSVKTATALSTGWCRRSGPAGSPPPRPVPPHAPDPCVAASRTRHCRCATGRATTVEMGPPGGSGGWWQHSPASLRQGHPSIVHQLGDQGLHSAFAGGDSSCRWHGCQTARAGRNLQEGPSKGEQLQRTTSSPAAELARGPSPHIPAVEPSSCQVSGVL